jgi:three-Cys-motif partner protein
MSELSHSQAFGGPWSLLKVDAVEKYLKAYSKLMETKPTVARRFTRVYIDAFAGSGKFSFDEDAGLSLWDRQSERQHHIGSALRALKIEPAFDRLFFIDLLRANIDALGQQIRNDDRVQLIHGDANIEVMRLRRELDWRSTRGVIFLDPFGASVEWETLKAINATKALDVWYLFPLHGLFRNAPRDRRSLTPDKEAAVTRLLGWPGWVDEFYAPRPPSLQTSMFDSSSDGTEYRDLNVSDMEAIVHRRLSTVFSHVEKPARLLGPSKAPLYSLFFAVSNPSPRAIEPAAKIARHILDQI